MNLLSIGNSFSHDAHQWLHQITTAAGDELVAVNLCIGGCSLETHWEKFVTDAPDYNLEINGVVMRPISLSEALGMMHWDVVTFQQASHFSGDFTTYMPYLTKLADAFRAACPDAQFYFHQTWSYETDSTHPGFVRYGSSQTQMYHLILDAAEKARSAIDARMIRSGELVQYMRENLPEFDYAGGGLSLNRDGFHLSWLYGRYAVALLWYCTLFGRPVPEVRFVPEYEGETADPQLLEVIHRAVAAFLQTRA